VWRVEIEVGVATPISSLAPCHHLVRRSALACSRIVKLRAAAGFEACAAESDFESKVSFDARNLAICDGEEDGRPFSQRSDWRKTPQEPFWVEDLLHRDVIIGDAHDCSLCPRGIGCRIASARSGIGNFGRNVDRTNRRRRSARHANVVRSASRSIIPMAAAFSKGRDGGRRPLE